MKSKQFEITLHRDQDFRFLVDFHDGELPFVWTDEHPPYGEGHGTHASCMLAAAVGHSLAAGVLKCLQDQDISVRDVKTNMHINLSPDDRAVHRIDKISVDIEVNSSLEKEEELRRHFSRINEYCAIGEQALDALNVEVDLKLKNGGVRPSIPLHQESLPMEMNGGEENENYTENKVA